MTTVPQTEREATRTSAQRASQFRAGCNGEDAPESATHGSEQ